MARKRMEKNGGSLWESYMQAVYWKSISIGVAYELKKCSVFAKALLRRKRHHIFRFFTDQSVESVNKRAERIIRPSAIYRKVSGGSISAKGILEFAKVCSMLDTLRKNVNFHSVVIRNNSRGLDSCHYRKK